DTDKPRSRTYAGRFAWTFRVQPRLIRGHKGLSGLRGWCLNKMNGFPIPESRQRFRSVERHRIDELMCKLRCTERAFGNRKRNGAGREWRERTTATWSVVTGMIVECLTVYVRVRAVGRRVSD